MTDSNRRWLLQRRPKGMVTQEDFCCVDSPMPQPDYDQGQILVRNLFLSFEPAMRGWLDDVPSYLPPVAIGEVMRAPAVAQVMRSQNPDYPEGSLVQGMFGWQEYAIGDPQAQVAPHCLPEGTPPTLVLSLFGGTSLTAYFGLLDIGRPRTNDTVLVSGAAGATGSIVAQIARIKGCRVIGIAGGEEKCNWLLDECRIDAVIDYHSERLDQRLLELSPAGINLFYDNVGGKTLETVFDYMADHGTIVMCGQISGYNDAEPQPGPSNLMQIITRRLRVQGFIAIDYMDRFQEAIDDLTNWMMAGELAWREDIQEGFENIPATMLRLFAGKNKGKQLLKLADPA